MSRNRKGEKERQRLKSVYGQLYKRATAVDLDNCFRCVCCGAPSDTMDHVPPLSTIEYCLISDNQSDFVRYPMCAECNAVGSDVYHTCIYERIDYIKAKLKRKYDSDLRAASMWEEDEVKTLGKFLKASVEAAIQNGKLVKARLEYPGHEIMIYGSNKSVEEFRRTALEVKYKRYQINGRTYPSEEEAIKTEAWIHGVTKRSVEGLLALTGDLGVSIKKAVVKRNATTIKSCLKNIEKEFAFIDKTVVGYVIERSAVLLKALDREVAPVYISKQIDDIFSDKEFYTEELSDKILEWLQK